MKLSKILMFGPLSLSTVLFVSKPFNTVYSPIPSLDLQHANGLVPYQYYREP